MSLKRVLQYLYGGLILIGMVGCEWPGKTALSEETMTRGTINISADESLKPLIAQEIDAFQTIYPDAEINVQYKPEAEVFKDLTHKEARLIFTTRKLNESEENVFEHWKVEPKQLRLAVDAVALILHRDNPDTTLKRQDLLAILSGQFTDWNDVYPESQLESPIELVVANEGSGPLRTLESLILNDDEVLAEITYAGSPEAVFDYVKAHPAAIGAVGFTWISDRDSDKTTELMKGLRLASIEAPDTSAAHGEFFQPYQAYLATRNYSLVRNVFSVSREPRNGLGTGFVNWIAGDKGQRIVLKTGLVPGFKPGRIVAFPPKEDAKDIQKVIKNKKKLYE